MLQRLALIALLLPAVGASQIIPRRQLLFQLDRSVKNGTPDRALQHLLETSPPTVFFDGLKPMVPSLPPPRKTLTADLAIFGGELEAVTTAMAAAKHGAKVVIITDAALGGLSSDLGGNLRYVDGIDSVPRTPSQLELFKAIGMEGHVAMPAQTDQRISRHLTDRYAKSISVLRVRSLTDLAVTKSGSELATVSTDQGVKVQARRFLDMDPECRLGEQAGLPMTVDVPNMAYGIVFDILHMKRSDWESLRSHDLITPEAIFAATGSRPTTSLAKASEARLRRDLRRDKTLVYSTSSLGYVALADGFDLWMNLRANTPRWLNERRICTGFNIAHFDDSANVNSVSYRLDEVILQHAHSLTREKRFADLVNAELAGLADYMRYVTGNSEVRVRFPAQFYVRRPTANVRTLTGYRLADFTRKPRTRWWMAYGMDYRGITPRDKWDVQFIRALTQDGYGTKRWDCKPETCSTAIPNLFVLNKCSVTPEFSGGLRIVQNLINTGQAWVEKTIAPSRAGATRRRR